MGAVVAVLLALLLSGARAEWAIAVEASTPLGRWTLGGHVEFYAVMRTDPDTRNQQPAGVFSLDLTGDVHRRARVFVAAPSTERRMNSGCAPSTTRFMFTICTRPFCTFWASTTKR